MVWGSEDNKGNNYTHIGGNVTTEGIICESGSNRVFLGKLNFGVRDGKSTFGKQLIIQFKLDKCIQTYPDNSPWDHFECYLSEQLAKEWIAQLNKFLNGDKKVERQGVL